MNNRNKKMILVNFNDKIMYNGIIIETLDFCSSVNILSKKASIYFKLKFKIFFCSKEIVKNRFV